MSDHFLAQYNQVWQQRRQHVTLIWAIPTIAVAMLALFLNALFAKENPESITLGFNSFVAMLTIGFGLCGLLLRHNFFIRVLGLLLQELDEKRIHLLLPQFGKEFRVIYRSRLSFWEKVGAIQDGTYWWLVVSAGLLLLLFALTIDFVAADVREIFEFCLKIMPWGLIILTLFFIKALMQFLSEKISQDKGEQEMCNFSILVDNPSIQNVFKIVTGIIAIAAFVFSLWTFNRSVVFGNRPLPKVQLDSAGEFFKILIANRGKDPLTKARLLFKFLPLKGDTPLEESAKTGKACAGLIEQEDPPAVFGTRVKVSDFDLNSGRVFVFALIHSDSLYGKKYYPEMFYRNSAGESWHRLNENYGALSDAHQDIARKQTQLLKNAIRRGDFDSFCKADVGKNENREYKQLLTRSPA